ncbi:virion structural protein [Aeromonas phage D3]|uniref:Virion structural protein n=3 Tax=Ludhianavirus TaxID=3044751 RepID=A0A514A1A7_9CAUD|nr:virion structural protein [Aeromonas phage LAh10]YP_010668578.1 virion structural protein [Aeromonas phage D3]YP_010668844.1 virion structural protein [Aeromonas phage D6]QEP52401.1 hypothetical protein D9_0194 [Aeromonas phage D9]QDH47060.1 hypothetical protein LAh10_28 [Aeromonas phage LAh10]QDJ97095.1 hypothetical protein D3_0097 [Aeromonas phage D3]QDJ97256.1 hypothetical protein D6_0096 [Aeromonas phage D6]
MAQTIIGATPAPKREERAMDPAYKHSLVESSYTPHTSMLSFVSGEPTLTEYYRGSYAQDEEQHSFEPQSIQTYASYKRINHLIMKLNVGENFMFDQVTGQSSVTITGYVLFDLTPNKGDLFIKDVGDGRAGLFTLVEQPEIYTVTADKCYGIEARMIGFVTQAIMDNLNSKVIEELWYQKDMAVAGGNAILSTMDHDLNKELYSAQIAIVEDVLANHYYWDEDTIAIPNDEEDLLYDPYLAKFLSYVIPTSLMGQRKKICLLSVNYWVDNRKMQEPLTIWDMFYRNDFSNPARFKQDFFVHPRNSLLNARTYGSVFFSKFDRAIVIHEKAARRDAYKMNGAMFAIGPSPTYSTTPGEPYSYYFSDEFYEGKSTNDNEKFVWDMFKDKTVDKKKLLEVLKGFWSMDEKDKLYMSGIYLLAIRMALVKSSAYV